MKRNVGRFYCPDWLAYTYLVLIVLGLINILMWVFK
jgi:hypothetical protein